ncbi:MAG: hypothetical protein HUU29_03125 [Planctomycetaceae bacterium]|nr:hypothetical protein [Planctomycetaceae bacterium]
MLFACPLFALHRSIVVTSIGNVPQSVKTSLERDTERLLAEIEHQTGLSYTGNVSLVLCGGNDDFLRHLSGYGAQGEYLGVAIAERESVALNLELIQRAGTSPESVYKHELCHLVLGANIARHLRPLWFEEGLAQWVSETPFESALSATGYISGTDVKPDSMDHISHMARDPAYMTSGYHHALAAIDDLESRFGPENVRALCDALKHATTSPAKTGFEQVFDGTMPRNFAAWEIDFIASRQRSFWMDALGFVGQYWFALIFLVATFFLFLALRKKRRREQLIVDNWNEQDELFQPDPEWSYEPEDFEAGFDGDEDWDEPDSQTPGEDGQKQPRQS